MLARSLLALLALVLVTASALADTPRTADEVVAEVRRATAKYQDIARARADGFVQISGMEARHGYHFINVNSPVAHRPPAWPPASWISRGRPCCLYVERDSVWKLVGVEYALPAAPCPIPGRRLVALARASCHYRDYQEIPARRVHDCPPRHPQSDEPFALWHPAFAVAHVWAWHENPDGPSRRRTVRSPRTAAPPAASRPPRAAQRAGARLFAVHASLRPGSVLLLLAAVIAGESRRRRDAPLVVAVVHAVDPLRPLPDSHVGPGVVAHGAGALRGHFHGTRWSCSTRRWRWSPSCSAWSES